MKCPIDQTELLKEKYEESVDVEVCKTCHGIWLDKGELEKIQNIKIHDYEADLARMPDHVGKAFSRAVAEMKTPVSCPVCGLEMERKEYAYCSQVLIDSCVKGHGVWLDADELRALEIFYERMAKESHDVKKGFLAGLFDSLNK